MNCRVAASSTGSYGFFWEAVNEQNLEVYREACTISEGI